MNEITSTKELYSELLTDLYCSKVNEVAALNFFEKHATAAGLKKLMHGHSGEIRMQVLRLAEMLDSRGESAIENHWRPMLAMVEEARELVSRCSEGELRDFAIAASVQRIKQCEIFIWSLLMDMADGSVPVNEVNTLRYNLGEDIEFQKALEKSTKPNGYYYENK